MSTLLKMQFLLLFFSKNSQTKQNGMGIMENWVILEKRKKQHKTISTSKKLKTLQIITHFLIKLRFSKKQTILFSKGKQLEN